MPHHVNEVLAHVSADRLMIGSDLPESVSTEIGKILDLDIPREAKEKILWQTGENLFQDHR
jgi:predicted TIM-barrel fold metal-dependent hydrolase